MIETFARTLAALPPASRMRFQLDLVHRFTVVVRDLLYESTPDTMEPPPRIVHALRVINEIQHMLSGGRLDGGRLTDLEWAESFAKSLFNYAESQGLGDTLSHEIERMIGHYSG